jgi:hypothetical protein
MSLRDKILSADDKPYEDVPCPEWGVIVRIRTVSAKERDAFEESAMVKVGKKRELSLSNFRARVVALCAVEEDGSRIFSDSDAEALGGKSPVAMERLAAVALRLNGWTEADVAELTKN